MNCRHAIDLLSPYVDGELSPVRASALEAHLHGCAVCRAELATLRHAVAALQTPPPLVRPEGLLDEFKRRLETAPPRRSLFPRLAAPWPVLVPACAALLVAAVLLPAVLRPARERARVSRPASGPVAQPSVAASRTQMARAPQLSLPREDTLLDRAASPTSTAILKPERQAAAPAAPAAGGNPRVVEDMRGVTGGSPSGRIAGRPSTTRPTAAVTPDVLYTSQDPRLGFRASAQPAPRPGTVPSAVQPRSRRHLGPPRLILPVGVDPPQPSGSPVKLARERSVPSNTAPSGLGGSGRRDDSPSPTTTPAPKEAARVAEHDAGVTRSWVALSPGGPSALSAPGVGFTAPGAPPPVAAPSESPELRATAADQAPPARRTPAAETARRQPRLARVNEKARGVPSALVTALQRPVNVAVQDVPLADLLQQLGKSAGVPVLLTTPTPETRRAHAELQGIALYEALQKVADAAGLIIAPQGAGVSLRPRTAVEPVASHPSVWSRDWGRVPQTLFAPRPPADGLQR